MSQIHAASLTEKCKNNIQFKSSLDDTEEMKNTFVLSRTNRILQHNETKNWLHMSKKCLNNDILFSLITTTKTRRVLY